MLTEFDTVPEPFCTIPHASRSFLAEKNREPYENSRDRDWNRMKTIEKRHSSRLLASCSSSESIRFPSILESFHTAHFCIDVKLSNVSETAAGSFVTLSRREE